MIPFALTLRALLKPQTRGCQVIRPLSASIPRLFLACFCCLLFLVTPDSSPAEVALSFIPIEESKYLLRGEGCEAVASVKLTIDYDTTYLSAPEVTVMGVRLPEGDHSATPGSLQLHILNDDHNAVFETTVYFQKRGDYPPVINFVTAEVADLSGAERPVPVEVMAPVNLPQSGEVPAVANPAQDQAATSQAGAADGSVREDSPPPADPPAGPPAATPPVTITSLAESGTDTSQKKQVAERFRDFSGKKSLAAFTALFAGNDPRCRQIPPVVIADGRRTARVVISSRESGDVAPLFTVSGGRLVSVERDRETTGWIAIVKPHANEWDVRLRANGTVDYPLTVAPAINVPPLELAGLDKKSFVPRLRSFLAERPPKGKRQYPVWLREYLFTANYLAAVGERH